MSANGNNNEMVMAKSDATIVAVPATHSESVKMKKCPKCGKVLPVTEFYSNARNSDGLQDKCKACQKEWNKEYVKRKREQMQSSENKIERKEVIIEEKSHTMTKVYTNPELAKFTPREMMSELKARGFRWEYMLEPQRKIYFDKI